MTNQNSNEISNIVGYDYVSVREGRDASDIPATSIIGESGGVLGSYLTKLSSSGNTIIVSDPVAYSNKGVVRVYCWEDAEWVQLGDDIIGAEPNRDSVGVGVPAPKIYNLSFSINQSNFLII